MTVINTNVSATLASNAISRNDRAMSTAMERLSTGLRINSAVTMLRVWQSHPGCGPRSMGLSKLRVMRMMVSP